MKQANAQPSKLWPILTLFLCVGLSIAPSTLVRAQSNADPWDVSWLPDDRPQVRALDQAIDGLLEDTGLRGQGATIRENAQRYGVNPAFALAMFRQEAGFATRGTLARSNKNPANIIATGECWGKPRGARCKGFYGEVSTDGRFGRYASMADGIEAFFVLMDHEYAGMPLHDLISRACPPAECDVPNYVARMQQWISEYQDLLLGAVHVQAEFTGAVLDDRAALFWRRGPAEYWRQSEVGYDGHMWWTRNNREAVENAGRWSLALEQPGTYAIYAYIPPLHATTRQGRYTIQCAGRAHQATIDQFAHRNQWVLLGRVRCAATEGEYVELSDETGEAPFETEIAFDAIGVRLLRGGAPARPTPVPSREPDVSRETTAAERPVLLARVWSTGRRLAPVCCGGGVLILVLGVLGIVFWGRLPSGLIR